MSLDQFRPGRGLQKPAKRPFHTSSYGHARRVLFARALVHEPELLLLDEPYAGVDSATRQFLGDHVTALHQSGRTIVHAGSLRSSSSRPRAQSA